MADRERTRPRNLKRHYEERVGGFEYHQQEQIFYHPDFGWSRDQVNLCLPTMDDKRGEEKESEFEAEGSYDSSPEKKPSLYKWGHYESGSSSDVDDPCQSPLRGVGDFYNGNKSIPIFTRRKTTFTTEGMVQLLFNATNDALKCIECPKQVQMNAVFLIDLRRIPLDDLRADGLPQYDNYDGKRTIPVDVEDDDNGELKVAVISFEQANSLPRARCYYLERLYHSWNVEQNNKFHRRIMHVRDENGAIVNNVACVQYIYDKEEMKFATKPHKSSKIGRGTPHTRTKPSIVRNLDRKLNTLIMPHFDYCSPVWDCLSGYLSDKLQKLQNRAARVITKSPFDASSNHPLSTLSWERLSLRRKKQKALMMYKTMNDLAPDYLQSLFSQRHSAYNLRNSEGRLTLSKPSTNYLKRSFSYSGAMLWNNLPKSLKNAASVEHFKRNIKKVADISDSHTAIM
ncbi:uncharacterized protein [Montipora foliosa]|uniref:uncharacterized protein n=1 Tax=Montipora foliosa TaxID=591990 RepID=UPI0035F0FD59